MNILITGGAGFIGSHITDLMIELGHEVVIIDNQGNAPAEYINAKAVFFNKDIRDDLTDVFESKNFDCVIHCAAQISVTDSIKNPEFNNDINVNGSLNLLSYFERYNLKRFIFLSSGAAVYGNLKYIPADENHPVQPLNPYGISKLEFEKILIKHAKKHYFDYVILRLPNVYGPRQNPALAVTPRFITSMLKGKMPTIFGRGEATRDFLYVEDLATAVEHALTSKSGIFNIGSGEETKIIELFNMIKKLIGSSVSAKHVEKRENEVEKTTLDCSLARKELKWHKNYSLEKGLKETIEWFREHA